MTVAPLMRFAGACVLAIGVGGCGKMAIDGEVVDVTGAPLADAVVTAVGQRCQTRTDLEGKFSLVCLPGMFSIHIGYEGFIEHQIEAYDASERKRYDLGKTVMVKMPSKKGLLKFDGGEYRLMEPGLLRLIKEGAGTAMSKRWCLPENGTPATRLAAGNQAFFDNETLGWRPFVLDDEGCAYRMSPNSKTSWGVDYNEKANFVTRQLVQGKTVVVMELPRGEYFIADWEGGFFTRAKLGDEKGFGGFYLKVE